MPHKNDHRLTIAAALAESGLHRLSLIFSTQLRDTRPSPLHLNIHLLIHLNTHLRGIRLDTQSLPIHVSRLATHSLKMT
jgi:hypothetical protein